MRVRERPRRTGRLAAERLRCDVRRRFAQGCPPCSPETRSSPSDPMRLWTNKRPRFGAFSSQPCGRLSRITPGERTFSSWSVRTDGHAHRAGRSPDRDPDHTAALKTKAAALEQEAHPGRPPLEDLVEFSAVEPNATALGAIVDLDALSLTHHKGNLTDRTWHTGGAGHRRTSSGWSSDHEPRPPISLTLMSTRHSCCGPTSQPHDRGCQRGPARTEHSGCVERRLQA